MVLSSPSPPVFRFCLDVLSSVSSTPVRIRSRIRGCVHLFGLVQSGSVSLSVPLLLQSTGPSERFFFPGVLTILSVGLLMTGFCVWLAAVSACGAALGPSVLEAYYVCLPFLGGESFDHPARTSSHFSTVELVFFSIATDFTL